MNILHNCIYDERLNVSSTNENLEIVVSDKEIISNIKAGKVSAILIPFVYSNVLYDEYAMLKDGFCNNKYDHMTVCDFRKRYKKHYSTLEFKHFGDNIPTRLVVKNPDWDVSSISNYFKLTWETA